MKKTAMLLSVVGLALLTSGCAPVSKTEKKMLKAPVNCATAEGDLRILQSEKDNLAKEIAMGASGIVPIGLVVHLIEGNEENTMKVSVGDYNDMLDKKEAQIRTDCNIPKK